MSIVKTSIEAQHNTLSYIANLSTLLPTAGPNISRDRRDNGSAFVW